MKHYFTVLRKYASVEGRASRAEYWNFVFFNYIVSVILAIIETSMHTHFIVITYAVAMFFPSLAVGMRRMHDLGKYGIYVLIPIYSHLLACLPSSKRANAYDFIPLAIQPQ